MSVAQRLAGSVARLARRAGLGPWPLRLPTRQRREPGQGCVPSRWNTPAPPRPGRRTAAPGDRAELGWGRPFTGSSGEVSPHHGSPPQGQGLRESPTQLRQKRPHPSQTGLEWPTLGRGPLSAQTGGGRLQASHCQPTCGFRLHPPCHLAPSRLGAKTKSVVRQLAARHSAAPRDPTQANASWMGWVT